MSQLTIIRASAGSGKTHTLTGKFLELLLNEPTDYFKGILAVTFTNKATAEMKNRLIEQLNILACGEKSDYLNNLKKITGFKEEHIRNKSSAILHNILHEYSWFSIETIDTFFQRIIRAFTRELAIPGNYNIETDTLPVLEYAVDNLIDGIKEDSDLLNWLVQFAELKIDEARPWDIRKELLNFGKEVFKEDFASISRQIYSSLADKEKFQNFIKHLNKIINETEQILSEYGRKGLEIIEKYGFEDSDFFRGSTGIPGYYKKLSDKQVIHPNSYVQKMMEGPENWPSSKTNKRQQIFEIAQTQLLPLLNDIVKYLGENSIRYNTSGEILKNVYSMGILSDLASYVAEYCRQKNTFILSDSPVFINRIIDRNDAPFIYEKLGNRYNHFMIDEFQDTSEMQWNNFKPLINNSLASGKNCLLVGDVKQSIYRWRNSSWEILANKVVNEYIPELISVETLDTNWRSSEEIVNFNNLLFPRLTELLQEQFNKKLTDNNNLAFNDFYNISEIYKKSGQKIPDKSNAKGNVTIRFFQKENITEEGPAHFEETLIEDLMQLFGSGYDPGDIAILVRNKSEGKKIADFIIEKNSEGFFENPFQVISNESLFLNASEVVNFLIAALHFIAEPEDDINRGRLAFLYLKSQSSGREHTDLNEIIFKQGCSSVKELSVLLPKEFICNISLFHSLSLYDLVERLISIFITDQYDFDIPYVHALLDLVYEYSQNNSSEIPKFIEYWNEEGNSKSISTSENQNALRILTIHKSKGLEFKAVIIPYCNWNLDQKSNTIIWTNAISPDLNYLPKIPVNYSAGLVNTEFSKMYFDELIKSYVDNLNLLYVALTRAEESLFVYSIFKDPDKKNYSVTTSGDLIYQAVAIPSSEVLNKNYNASDKIFRAGIMKPVPNSMNDAKLQEKIIKKGAYLKIMEKLFLKFHSVDFFKDISNELPNQAKKGSVFHGILAGINTIDELDKVTNKAIYEGLITKEEATDLKVYIRNCLSEPKSKAWFDGSAEIMNESEIILPGGILRRPDRVVIFKDQMDIIDYKFGLKKDIGLHSQQVSEYVKLAREMGYRNVKGFIWYIVTNEIIEV